MVFSEPVVTFYRSIGGAIASFFGGGFVAQVVSVNAFEIEQGVLYGLLSAILYFVWRASAFVKGINDKLRVAEDDRKEQAQAVKELNHKFKNLDKQFAVMASRCPANIPASGDGKKPKTFQCGD